MWPCAAVGGAHTIENCLFYAYTGLNPQHPEYGLTANFGVGCLNPWCASGGNTPIPGQVIRVPLANDPAYPFAEFHYAPATTVFKSCDEPCVTPGSRLVLHRCAPSGYTMFDIVPNLIWMSLTPVQLWVNGVATAWAQDAPYKIALIDNGGGPVLLSGPFLQVCCGTCPDSTQCPSALTGGTNCRCSSAPIASSLKG